MTVFTYSSFHLPFHLIIVHALHLYSFKKPSGPAPFDMAPTPKPNMVDKVMIAPKLLRALLSAILRLGWWPFAGQAKQKQIFKDFAFALLRQQLSTLSPAQEQWSIGTTEKVYVDYMKKTKMQPQTDTLDSGLKLLWLGDKDAEKIIIYFHGGGYVLAATAGHIQWLSELQKDLSKKHSVSVVVPCYTLAPTAQYPEQLKEAAQSLEWALTTLGKKPSDVCSTSRPVYEPRS